MQKLELEATDENILQTLSNDIIGRNEDLYDFLSILDTIEGNMSVAIDGDWGSGKTFFVKQAELLLNYYRKINYEQDLSDEENQLAEIIHKNTHLSKINLTQNYIPVYYNAWLYDDHNDPILSLMYSIVQTYDLEHFTQTKSKLVANIGNILNLIAVPTNLNPNFSDIKDGTNLINTIKSRENIKTTLREIFSEVINEHCDKLVVFIDEVDRCNPQYAVSVMERIKHFFQDERVIFVYSTNKPQLLHTVKNFYGSNFDASRYLNKFFDLTIKLNDIDIDRYIEHAGGYKTKGDSFYEMVYSMASFYNLSMRDCNRYIQSIIGFHEIVQQYNTLYTYIPYWIILFVPIVFALRVFNTEISEQFERGDNFDELNRILTSSTSVFNIFQRMFKILNKNVAVDSEDVLSEAQIVYNELFASQSEEKIVDFDDKKKFRKLISVNNINR